jgi:hypothetical protein
MTTLVIAPIVEGYGEVEAVRTLLTRTAEMLGLPCVLQILKPFRVSRSKVVSDESELIRALDFTALKLNDAQGDRRFALLMLDADQDRACELAPRLLQVARANRADLDVACVLPVVEYETWLVAGAETLSRFLMSGYESHIPTDPEGERAAKGWIQHFFAGPKYSEAADQVRLTAAFDVGRARQRSPSFDKLCRDLEARCR